MPGQREHGLGQNRAADQRAGLQARERDHRQQRVAQHVTALDTPSDRPLARAVLTKSSRLTSSIEARVMRA